MSKSSSSSGVMVIGLLGILFIGLWWMLSPLWLPLVVLVVLFVGWAVCVLIVG